MLLDARNDPDVQLDADVCIIGAGAAGITLALELDKGPLRIVLLESGGLEYDQVVQALNKAENVSFNRFPIETTRMRGLGGTTQHYGGMTPWFAPSDFYPRSGARTAAWPFGLDELMPYYRRAHEVCRLGPIFSSDAEVWQRAVGLEPIHMFEGPVRITPAPFSAPARFGKMYLEPLKGSSVRVLLWATALRLEANETGEVVEAVTCTSFHGATFSVRARYFVLAVGGMETPRLLLLSNVQVPAGLGNQHNQVGRYYMDHVTLWGGVARLTVASSQLGFLLETHKSGESKVQGIIRPTEETLAKDPVGNFWSMLTPVPISFEGVEAAHEFVEELRSAHLSDDVSTTLIDILVNIDELSDIAVRNVIGGRQTLLPKISRNASESSRYASIFMSMEQYPSADSRITLADEHDALGQRKLRLDWRYTDSDVYTWRRAIELTGAGLAANRLGRVRVTREIYNDAAYALTGISSHAMGAARMSTDPTSGVVDADCRVHGVENLFVASAAVFPTGSCANPTFTIVALAIRLADHLKGLST